MQISTGIPRNTHINLLCYHWQSIIGNSEIMHCGILFSIPYSKIMKNPIDNMLAFISSQEMDSNWGCIVCPEVHIPFNWEKVEVPSQKYNWAMEGVAINFC